MKITEYDRRVAAKRAARERQAREALEALEPGTPVVETEYGLIGRIVKVTGEVEVDHDYDGGGFDFWPIASTRAATPAEVQGEGVRVPPAPVEVPNPIVRTTPLSLADGSWTVREYRDGSFDASCGKGGLTRSVATFDEALAEVRRIEAL